MCFPPSSSFGTQTTGHGGFKMINGPDISIRYNSLGEDRRLYVGLALPTMLIHLTALYERYQFATVLYDGYVNPFFESCVISDSLLQCFFLL